MVIAWGLSAIASGVSRRVEAAEQERGDKAEDPEFIKAAKRQVTLSIVGATLCVTAAAASALGLRKTRSR